MKLLSLIIGFCLLTLCTACSPEVGSEAWCSNIKEKPAADWTTNEAKAYAQHCILKTGR